jgi:hypothetical protein
VASSYLELWRLHGWLGNRALILRRLRQAGHRRGARQRVLDIGGARGALLGEIQSKLGYEVVGIDLRPPPGDSAIEIHVGNAVLDPLPPANVAVAIMVVHHLSPTQVVALIENVGRSCDRLILLDLVRHPVPLALFRIFVAPWLGRINASDGATSIRRAYTVEELRELVDQAVRGSGLGSGRPIAKVRHTVAPLWMRQVVEIAWK